MYSKLPGIHMKAFTLYFLILTLLGTGCSNADYSSDDSLLTPLPLAYAEGFGIFQGKGYKVIELYKAFPNEHPIYRYLVLEDPEATPEMDGFDAIVTLPVDKVVLTSTTHVPHLDYLNCTELLAGFPNLDLISSARARERIESGKVKELGSGAQANIEQVIELAPDWMMVSTLGEDLKNLEILKKARIPAILNGEYLEQHPLGRAEWIKLTGALTGRYAQADEAFSEIVTAYNEAIEAISDVANKPTVMAGVMYKDIWYVPGSESWGARLLEAAGGQYVFGAQKGTGSVQLNYEYVLDQAEDAAFWLGASDYNSLEAMAKADPRYKHFRAFQNGNVYTYTLKKGPTGGIAYFELGYLRPDLILKDLIKILHPEILPDYEFYFYQKLDGQ
jgi:iron complex transport system substrate-binding protein